jgi:hypothetical protein
VRPMSDSALSRADCVQYAGSARLGVVFHAWSRRRYVLPWGRLEPLGLDFCRVSGEKVSVGYEGLEGVDSVAGQPLQFCGR